MPMTKQERDELKEECDWADKHAVKHSKQSRLFNISVPADKLRELLDEAERWQAIVKWAQNRVHHENDKTDHYYRGVGAACRAILDRVPAAPAPQGEPEG